ncbi:MAG: class I SAM-dependent methyltransferase [Pseudomonadota bacterium]|nr:class I SAM-dependent methyltransferase [Pseudomonadota bacterium]
MLKLYSERIFPHVLDRVMQISSLTELRQQLITPITGHVVEIGFGTGLNLPFYGTGVLSLTTVDPNAGVAKLAELRMQNIRFPVQQKLISAERLPFEDASVDTVVSTWTLCSIPDVASALQEIKRILKPDGIFHFVEHGLSAKPSVARWQHRLTPIQKVVADGCHLNRDMVALINQAGFTWIECQQHDVAGVPSIGNPMTLGRVKPSV